MGMLKQLFGNIKGAYFDKRKKLPETNTQQLLILMGAIYLEENQALQNIQELWESGFETTPQVSDWDVTEYERFKNDLMEEYGPLDMQMYGSDFKTTARESLKQMWGITSKEETLATLQWLINCGHRGYFKAMSGYSEQYANFSPENIRAFVQEYNARYSDDIHETDELFEFRVNHATEAVKTLPQYQILAWDMARYVHVVRLCFIADFLTDLECWTELEKISALCVGAFKNWEDFSESFFAGRIFWGEDDSANDPLFSAGERLLSHPMSPWLHFSWNV